MTAQHDTHDKKIAEALESARYLTRSGVPIFVAYPDQEGGYHLPREWQETKANPAFIYAWRPGRALCAVMGQGIDLVDVDPRNGGDASTLSLPRIFAEAATPSGGVHYFIASLGVRSRDGFLPGIDYKGGALDGRGRGFAYIAPTIRTSKVTGELVAYSWTKAPDLTGIGEDDTGTVLQELLASLRRGRSDSAAAKEAGAIPEGKRNTTLTSLAGTMRRRAMTEEEIGVALWAVNAARCVPPLPERDVLAIARSVARYRPAPPPAVLDRRSSAKARAFR